MVDTNGLMTNTSMKPKYLWLLFHGLWSMALVVSCKSSEVNPIDNLVGLYQGDTYPKDYVPPYAYSSRITLKKETDGYIYMTAYEVRYKTVLTQEHGFEDFYKDVIFPKCKIVMIDTTGLVGNPHFAKIINTENNEELGRIRNWVANPNGVKTKYFQLQVDFFVNDTIHFFPNVYKWAD